MYVFFSHESKYDLQLSDLHENCAHRVFLTDSEVFCLSHENILGHKTHGMTCTALLVGPTAHACTAGERLLKDASTNIDLPFFIPFM